MKVIGFSGKSGHGKDTCAKLVSEIMMEDYGKHIGIWPLSTTLKTRVYAEHKGEFSFEDVWFNKPERIRDILQKVGTEKGREVFGEDFWILQMEALLKSFKNNLPFLDTIAIPDIRFPNEISFVKLGGRVSNIVLAKILDQALERYGVTDDEEERLLEENPELLLSIDADVEEYVLVNYAIELEKASGIVLYIESDRPTLSDAAAQHSSESILDNIDKQEWFDGVIVNNSTTTFSELKDQLRPFVNQLVYM